MSDPTSEPGTDKSQTVRGGLSREDRSRFKRRVADLDRKLDNLRSPRERAQRESGGSRATGRGMAYGLRMASELVAAVLVGSAIGYGLDHWLGTSGPWFFLIFFMIGFAAGILNILRAYKRLQAEIDAETGGYIGEDLPRDDDND